MPQPQNATNAIMMIVGLGNPGKEYEATRHNVGQQAITRLFARHGATLDWQPERGAMVGKGTVRGRKVMLVTPSDFYMNDSGAPVQKIAAFYKIQPADMLIVFDDKEIPLGTIRIRASGSAGGHKGMLSVIERLGTEEIPRLRVGIGTEASHRADAAKFVLGRPTPEEKNELFAALDRAAEAIETILEHGLEEAMNRYNR